jgi:hypothetical protein
VLCFGDDICYKFYLLRIINKWLLVSGFKG